jgi:hypothetical protein
MILATRWWKSGNACFCPANMKAVPEFEFHFQSTSTASMDGEELGAAANCNTQLEVKVSFRGLSFVIYCP